MSKEAAQIRDDSFDDEKARTNHIEEAFTTAPVIELTEEEKAVERKLVRKLDRVIIPLTALLYLSGYLDRGNIGNAKLQGLFTLLDDDDTKYSIVLMSFFITYIIFSIPGTLLAKATSPALTIATGCLIWAVAASCMAGVQGFASMIVCRLFIGLGESMFGQAVAFHYSLWYTPNEIAKRLSIFIGCGVLAGAFGGLIAYGVSHIKSSIATFRILFLIEGVPSFVLGLFVLFFLPSRPETSRYLNEKERSVQFLRMDRLNLVEKKKGIDWVAIKYALTDWKTYVISITYSCMNFGLGSVSGFLPTIIKTMGYTNSEAQLYTVPPYAVALVFTLTVCYFSDRQKRRGLYVSLVFALASVGWLILLIVHKNQKVRYFATFLVVIGSYGAIPLIMSWVANNVRYSESARAVSLGMLNTVGQCLAIAASFLFVSKDGPKWTKGFSCNLAMSGLAVILSLFMTAYYHRENAKRDEAEGGPPAKAVTLDTTVLYDKTIGYRYVV
nr:MFS general substrate transporter [Phaffia rhodozyma]